MKTIAITRGLSSALNHCELTHRDRQPIDVPGAARQHEAYEAALRGLGCSLIRLPGDPELPDCAFVEDMAVVLDEIAVIARPGASARRLEAAPIVAELGHWRSLHFIEAPAVLDGGDVLRVGRTLFAGLSTRTSAEGVEALRAAVAPFGHEVVAVPVRGCLHLKTGVTAIDDTTLLINPDWVSVDYLARFDLLEVDPAEPWAANALRIGSAVVMAAEHPRTVERVAARGIEVLPVELGEIAKAEAGPTCLSLVFRGDERS